MKPHQKDRLMKQHLEQWKTSGSTQTDYCHQHNIPIHIFSYYKKKLGDGKVPSSRGKHQLIPVNILPQPGHSAPIHIRHSSGFSVEVQPASNLAELKPVLELLQSLS